MIARKKKFEANSNRIEKAIKKIYLDSGQHIPWSFIQSKLRNVDLGENVDLPNQQRIQYNMCHNSQKDDSPAKITLWRGEESDRYVSGRFK